MSTIFKSNFTVTSPTGLKLKTDPMDSAQALLIHDLSVVPGYPSQINPLAIGVKLVNLATESPISTQGFTPQRYAATFVNKALEFTGGNNGQNMILGSTTSPYTVLPIAGQTTDFLIITWVRIDSESTLDSISEAESLDATGANSNIRALFKLGVGAVANAFDLFINGFAIPRIINGYVLGQWFQLAVYYRCQGYNGKGGVVKVYKNGAEIYQNSTGLKSSFYASDSTKKTVISPEFGGVDGALGRIVMMSEIDAAGLNSDDLVINDFNARNGTWV